jgi:hypothetical protein
VTWSVDVDDDHLTEHLVRFLQSVAAQPVPEPQMRAEARIAGVVVDDHVGAAHSEGEPGARLAADVREIRAGDRPERPQVVRHGGARHRGPRCVRLGCLRRGHHGLLRQSSPGDHAELITRAVRIGDRDGPRDDPRVAIVASLDLALRALDPYRVTVHSGAVRLVRRAGPSDDELPALGRVVDRGIGVQRLRGLVASGRRSGLVARERLG